MTDHELQRDEPGGEDFAERAADATDEARLEAGLEGRTIEDQPDPLAVDEGDEEVTDY